jgi:hypothetical protein
VRAAAKFDPSQQKKHCAHPKERKFIKKEKKRRKEGRDVQQKQ